MVRSKKKLVVLTGAGISAESGLKTFRDMNGLWEEYRVEDVATPEGWVRDPGLVLYFYNQRRTQLKTAKPNSAHVGLHDLEKCFDVSIITQNVDNLHEQAGSQKVVHLHGELTKVRSTKDERLIYDVGYKDVNMGDKCKLGSQLRPHIVWFGEAVPMMNQAVAIASTADIFVVVGTSLNVYPAAGLYHYIPSGAPIFVIDPSSSVTIASHGHKVTYITKKATEGVEELKKILLEEYCDKD